MSLEIVTIDLPSRVPGGHEQEGRRPALVVADLATVGPLRFPMVIIVPLTTYRRQPWQAANPTIYPILAAGTAGLMVDSIALLDQIQAVDALRLISMRDTLPPSDAEPIMRGLQRALKI